MSMGLPLNTFAKDLVNMIGPFMSLIDDHGLHITLYWEHTCTKPNLDYIYGRPLASISNVIIPYFCICDCLLVGQITPTKITFDFL